MKIIKKKHSKKLSFSFAFLPIYLRCSCTVNTSEESVHWLVLPSKSRGAFSAPWSSPLQDHRKPVPAGHRRRETFSTGVWEGVAWLHLLGHSPTSASEPDSLSASPPAPSGTHGTSLSHQRLTPPSEPKCTHIRHHSSILEWRTTSPLGKNFRFKQHTMEAYFWKGEPFWSYLKWTM